MKIKKFLNEDDWMEARRGKITGTRLKDLISKRSGDKKIGFYEVIAERIAIPRSEENVMDRGKRLEQEAVDRFVKETGRKAVRELVLVYRDDCEEIAYSPDAMIGKTEDVEVKCLSSARHIEALLTKQVPSEYEYQVLQAFIVNDKLKKRYVVFYDPRMPKDFFFIEVNRKDVKDKIAELLVLEKQVLEEIAKLEDQLTF